MLSQGVDVNPKDWWGRTPLDDAKDRHNQNVTEILQKHRQAMNLHGKSLFSLKIAEILVLSKCQQHSIRVVGYLYLVLKR